MTAAVGRPSKLTTERQAEIVKMVKAGVPNATAAQVAGVTESTFYLWMEKGQDPENHDPIYTEFSEAVLRARAEAEAAMVANIRLHARNGDWKADAWLLERSRPERWGRVNRHELTGAGGGAIRVETETIETLLLDAGRAVQVADDAIDAELAALDEGGQA